MRRASVTYYLTQVTEQVGTSKYSAVPFIKVASA
jgi:hypothetical protein